ncbi:MAG TPA: hypothetical protein VG167_00485 [Verrucomicrobiae bacterium]|nr:hypothetical protein [Verrucomicrobiae bacterium]
MTPIRRAAFWTWNSLAVSRAASWTAAVLCRCGCRPACESARGLAQSKTLREIGAPRSSAWLLVATLFLFGAGTPLFAAQTSTNQSHDPLMSLMLSSPSIDLDSPVVPTASFDPPIIRPGETATYRVMVNALEQSIELPNPLPAPAALKLQRGAQGEMLAFTGLKLQPRTCFNFHIAAAQAGQYVIPEFKAKVYDREVTVPAAVLEVTDAPPESVTPAPQLLIDLPDTNVYVGQSLRAIIRFPASPNSQLFLPVQTPPIQINGQGLILDYGSLRQHIEQMYRRPGMGSSPSLVYEASITPIAIGSLSLSAQSFVGNRFGGNTIVISGPNHMTFSGGPPQYTLLESEPVTLQVRPLPREGRLPGFTGAVGMFTIEPPALSSTEARVGDMLKLTLRVRGDANSNLPRLVAPPVPQLNDWQIFAVPSENLPLPAIQAQGFASFTYALVPLSTSIRATPKIPFCCFNPERGSYVDLSIQPIPITVKPGPAGADLRALLRANAAAVQPEKELTLSGLDSAPGISAATLVPNQNQPWFPLLQLTPLATFAGLWAWERRRRFLEQHPDVMLRRRARRALHRERRLLYKAARTGDGPRFAASAVKAMRVACAPHYPAEPRALVGQDVLELLPEPERTTRSGQTVRRFFAVSDETQFGEIRRDPAELLPLKPDLDCVLEQLEAKL